MIRASDNRHLSLHEKHRFISPEWWHQFCMDWIMDVGVIPVDDQGFMATSRLRDARRGVYKLRSFRQMVVERERKDAS